MDENVWDIFFHFYKISTAQIQFNSFFSHSSTSIGKLNKFEIPAAITICKEAWTPESGLVTANLKINRRKIYEYYENEIQQMFSNKSAGLIF